MANTTSNSYVGDGSTSLFSFTFPYIEPTDVYVSVDGVLQHVQLNIPTPTLLLSPSLLLLLMEQRLGFIVRLIRLTFNGSSSPVLLFGDKI